MRKVVPYKQISRMASFHFGVDTVKSCYKILWCPLLCSFVNTTNLIESHPIFVRYIYKLLLFGVFFCTKSDTSFKESLSLPHQNLTQEEAWISGSNINKYQGSWRNLFSEVSLFFCNLFPAQAESKAHPHDN